MKKITKETIRVNSFFKTIEKSKELMKLSFPLFDLLKKDLGKEYLITDIDIRFLYILDFCVVENKKGTMINIAKVLNGFHQDKNICKLLYDVHCDPYELFIDAGWIDNKLGLLLK